MNQLKKLTLKYFFQQKWEEIKWWVIPISVILGVILIGFGLGSFPAENGIYSIKMIIIGVSILGSWSLVGIIELIKTLFYIPPFINIKHHFNSYFSLFTKIHSIYRKPPFINLSVLKKYIFFKLPLGF